MSTLGKPSSNHVGGRSLTLRYLRCLRVEFLETRSLPVTKRVIKVGKTKASLFAFRLLLILLFDLIAIGRFANIRIKVAVEKVIDRRVLDFTAAIIQSSPGKSSPGKSETKSMTRMQ